MPDQSDKPDKIDEICGGKNKQYQNVPCEYYEAATRYCMLLKEGRIIEIWQKDRCFSYQILNQALQKRFAQIRENFPRLNTDGDFIEDIDFKKIIYTIDKTLSQNPLRVPTLAQWIKYLRTTASNYVSDYLMPKSRCGVCKYLSSSDVCQLKEFMLNGESLQNPHYGKKRKRSDKPCKNGYAPDLPEFTSSDYSQHDETRFQEIGTGISELYEEIREPNIDVEASVTHKSFVFHISDLLKKRAEAAERNSKQRERFMRQYAIFMRYYQFIRENPEIKTRKDINTLFRKKFKLSNIQFNRDFKEIREYIKEMIQNDI